MIEITGFSFGLGLCPFRPRPGLKGAEAKVRVDCIVIPTAFGLLRWTAVTFVFRVLII